MSKKRFRMNEPQEQNDIQPEAIEPEVVEEVVEPEPEVFGVVTDCTKLNVRRIPATAGEVVCVVNAGDELMIDMDNSTNDWYKVVTASSNEGYCMKKFITLKQ